MIKIDVKVVNFSAYNHNLLLRYPVFGFLKYDRFRYAYDGEYQPNLQKKTEFRFSVLLVSWFISLKSANWHQKIPTLAITF